MDIASTLTFRLHALVYTLDTIADSVITRQSPINFSQFLVLLSVYQHSGATQKHIASWLHITEATVSYTVSKLVGAGLLIAAPSPQDGRKNSLTLTDDGQALVQRLYTQLDQAIKPLFATLPKTRLKRLDRDIEMLVGVLNNHPSR